MELTIGSNVFRNASGVIKIEGKEQIVLEVRAEDPRLLLTLDLYEADGVHVAHLRRNVWRFNAKTRFELETSPVLSLFTYPFWVKILDTQTGAAVLDIHLVKEDTVFVASGRIHSHKGRLLEVTPHFLRFPGTPTMFGSAQDVRGTAVSIG
ncbi:hypothetical protein [Candidatus Nitrospira bockiana]